MPLPKRRSQYRDVEQVLEAAYSLGKPTEFKVDTYKQAVRWRLRAYYLRTLMADEGDNRFDNLKLSVTQGRAVVNISFVEPEGVLQTPEGEVVETGHIRTREDQVYARAEEGIEDLIDKLEIDTSILDKL